MKVKVLEKCVGCGACSQLNSEVFDIHSRHAVVNNHKILGNEVSCIDAAITCPVNAIMLE